MARLPGATIEEKLLLNSVRDGACLRWQGAHTPAGYGHITIDRRGRAVHRVAYELWVGPIPTGHEVDHVARRGCRWRDCINPAHLEAVTQAENKRRQRKHPRRTACHRGHRLTDENVYVRPNGDHSCRECKRARQRAYKARKGAGRG